VHSGFVALVGRPNVGKSSLLNAVCGAKVSIVSNKAQTTRHRVRAVLHGADAQVVFVDTPGVHKAVSALGERVNATALESIDDVDITCLVIDATKPFGRGDQFVADRLKMENTFVVVNKVDAVSRQKLLQQLAAVSTLGAREYFPVSARTGEGIDVLVSALRGSMPEGPEYFPRDVSTDTEEGQWVAELVREQLLERFADELPYSIATRVTEWEWPRIRCEIVVERDSQKGMVIGKGGLMLKEVGQAVRAQLPAGAYLELHVSVEKDWQRRPDKIERLGY
jgi:GTP-binding protein Era